MMASDEDCPDSGDASSLIRDTQWRQVAQRHYEHDRDTELTTAIVFAIATAKDVSPTEIRSPPLYEAVDVAAIEAAFFRLGRDAGARQGTGTVEFRYTDYLVKVTSDGWIQVYERGLGTIDDE
ncbi:hypothetical protein OB919_19340 [Halobacteria archaeon AArc-curdl1]|uniref:Halobacterial output domain-containing protein n=1 Tax=Natronosalvus hydrolyticus TaxID=2979988 RepID=A0AAP3E8P6_9EURY|nr:hypothetical protein [Halobacteria archaeon AArc-curdl1]